MKWYIAHLRPQKKPEQLLLYQVRAKNEKTARLLMRLQGVLPSNNIVSMEGQRFWLSLAGVLFPRLGVIKKNEGKITVVTSLRYFGRRIQCLFVRHVPKRFGPDGEVCRRCSALFPDSEGAES